MKQNIEQKEEPLQIEQKEEQLKKFLEEQLKKFLEEQQKFFQELKQLYNINIPIHKPPVNQANQPQKFIIYIDLTNTQIYSDALLNLSINKKDERRWLGGFLGEFKFSNKKKEEQHIFCYYFNKIIENDENINIQNLFRFRLFLQEFISTQQNYQMKYVFHFSKKNKNQKEFEDHIIKFVYLILEGSFDKLQDIICVYNEQGNQQINYCKISCQKIHFNETQSFLRCDFSFIEKLDEFLGYFKFQQKDPNIIGFECQKYIQKGVDVVLKLFEIELKRLQSDIQKMIEFPVNLDNEKEINEEVKQYLIILKTIIHEIQKILQKQIEFDQMIIQIQQLLKNKRDIIIQNLTKIVEKVKQFEIFMKINFADQLPDQVFNELLQFSFFNLIESNQEILQKLKKHNFNTDCIKATLCRVIMDMKQWFEQFDKCIPQNLAYLNRLIPQNCNLNQDEPYIFVFGDTRVGKSTLINILSKPENIVVKENKFDVKEKNKQILISDRQDSETYKIQIIEIETNLEQSKEPKKFQFVDTPGLNDTISMNRIINQIQMCHYINEATKKIFLFMIDGSQKQFKNQLINSMETLILTLGTQNIDSCFENLIIPVFTKLKDDSTMKSIIDIWKNEMKNNINDKTQLKILNAIEKSFDEDNYIKIYSAEYYLVQQDRQKLESDIKDMKIKFFDCVSNKMPDVAEKLQQEIIQKEGQLQKPNDQTFSQRIQKIKDDIIQKCNNKLKQVSNQRQIINQSLKFKLTPELKYQLEMLLPYVENCCQHYFNIAANDFISKILFDHSKSLEEKFQNINSVYYCKREDLTFKQVITENENIYNKVKQLNHFRTFILPKFSNKQLKYEVDDEEFKKKHLIVLHQAFSKVVPKLTSNFFEYIKYEYYTTPLKIMGIVIMSIQSLSLSSINVIFKNNLFVEQEEKEKKKKQLCLRSRSP